MIILAISCIVTLLATLALGLNLSYIKSKPLGLQSLPDIARCDVILSALATTYIFFTITMIHDIVGNVHETFALVLTSSFVIVGFAFLINVIIYQSLLYACTFYGVYVSEFNEENVQSCSRWINTILTVALSIYDICFYKVNQGSIFQFLVKGSDLDAVPRNGPAQLVIIVALLISVAGFQIHLEVASFSSGEKVGGITRNLRKFCSGKRDVSINATEDESVSLQSMRILSLIAGSVFVFMFVNVTSSMIWPQEFSGIVKDILVWNMLISVLYPGILILKSPKIFEHSKRVVAGLYHCGGLFH